jgi:uncharacterized protein (TIGR00251 family)
MYIHVKAMPGAKKEQVVKKSDSHFLVSVKEPAERGLANKRILELISSYFKTKKVRIISGYNSRSKLLSVDL